MPPLAALLWLVAAPGPGPTPPNLLLVTIDTVRADHLRAYGNAAVETPATDRLAREGVLLEDATVQVPQTRPSHVSILTGLYPFEHGVHDNFSPPLRTGVATLATLLAAQGFDTAAFIGGFPLVASSGLARGFQVYDDALGGAGSLSERKAAAVAESALQWLSRARSRPFFAWVHFYDPHAPYEPPPPFDRRYAAHPYDGEIAYADSQLGRLVEALDEQRIRQRTLVVVTSDHGEGLGEHGEEEHLLFVYDATLHVPLLLSWPGTLPQGARASGQFRSVDLLPTVLELMGLPVPATSGLSRAGALRSGASWPKNESYSESRYGKLHFGYAALKALRAEGYKYIEAPRPELYNLREDPGETRNLVNERAPLAEAMRARLATYDRGPPPAPVAPPPDSGDLERLVALGYVSGAAGGGGASTGADPKDKIGELQSYTHDLQKAIALSRAGDVDGGVAILSRLSRTASVSFEVQYFLGRGLLRKGRYAEAAAALEEARGLLPRHADTYVFLAQALRQGGHPEEGRRAAEKGLALAPKSAPLWEEEGIALGQLGDLAAAQKALETARAIDPRALRARLALSALYRDQGRSEAALGEVQEAVRLEPGFGDGWNALGVLLGSVGRSVEAARAFESALRIRRDDPDALFNLAAVHLGRGEPASALPLLERLVSVAPAFPGAREALAEARRPTAGAACPRLRILRVAGEAEAEALARRAAEGESFDALVRAASTDPFAPKGDDLGNVCIADLAEPLRSAAAELGAGAWSRVLKTPAGFVLLKRDP